MLSCLNESLTECAVRELARIERLIASLLDNVGTYVHGEEVNFEKFNREKFTDQHLSYLVALMRMGK